MGNLKRRVARLESVKEPDLWLRIQELHSRYLDSPYGEIAERWGAVQAILQKARMRREEGGKSPRQSL